MGASNICAQSKTVESSALQVILEQTERHLWEDKWLQISHGLTTMTLKEEMQSLQ